MAEHDRGARAPLVISEGVRRGLAALATAAGAVCLAAGMALIGALAWLVYLLVDDPQRLPFAPQLAALAASGRWAARGVFEGRPYELELGEPLYWLVVAIVAVLLLAVLAGVAKSLLATGTALLRR